MFAAVVVFALFSVGGCSNGPGVATGTAASHTQASGPTPSPTAVRTAVPSSSASWVDLPVGSLDPETTYRISDRCCVGSAGMYLTAPAGWDTIDTIFIGRNVLGDPDLYDVLLGGHLVGNVYTGGCHWQGTALDPPVGPTVCDLATALGAQGG
jgi:hypothetical protein